MSWTADDRVVEKLKFFLEPSVLDMQDNDVERETTLNRDHLDYLVEESWRWLLSCKMTDSHCVVHDMHGKSAL